MFKKMLSALAALAIVGVGAVTLAGPASADTVGSAVCTPSEGVAAYDEPSIHHDAVYAPGAHHDAVDAVTEFVNYNWTGGPVDEAPAFPGDGWHKNNGEHNGVKHQPKTDGRTYNTSEGDNGRASWFHWSLEVVTPGVAAYNDEPTLVTAAYDEPGAHHDAVPAVVCDDEPVIVTEWHTWQTPVWFEGLNGHVGAPSSAWNQTYVGAGQVPPTECETTYQQDKYTGTREQIDAVLADQILTGPNPYEDAAIVKDWTFVSTDKCRQIPSHGEPRVTTNSWDVITCVEPLNGVATITTYAVDTTYPLTFDTDTWTWVEGQGVPGEQYVADEQQVDAESCVPVAVTPTPTQTETVATVVATPEPTVSATPAPVTAPKLATTGGEGAPLGLLAGIFLLAGIAAVVIRKRSQRV